MSDLVVESSVAVKWFLTEPYSTEARRILGEYEKGAMSLLAPDLINAEVGNVIWKKQAFQGLAAADAQDIVIAFRRLALTLTPTADLLEDAFRLVATHQRSVYDALYLALSLRIGCQCVTADERLCNSVGSAFPNLLWLANWS
jgi:predicted nucleic acid-binding protein